MKLTRKQVINILNTLKLEWSELAPPKDNICDALEYAISSLKTDEAYQIMYEGEEVYTKADVVAMLEEIQDEIFKESWRLECICDDLDGSAVDLDDINNVIQQKINVLKENKDG